MVATGDKYQGLEKCGCKLCTCSSITAALQHRLHCECAGVGAARAAGVAGPLADALFISARILRERDLEHEHLTALTAVWGQLVSHDIAYTLPISGYSQCCQAMFREEQHPECLPVVMPDYVCQEYVRSAIGLKPGCLLGPRYAGYNTPRSVKVPVFYLQTISKVSRRQVSLDGGQIKPI